jgi:hypothetical protein
MVLLLVIQMHLAKRRTLWDGRWISVLQEAL